MTENRVTDKQVSSVIVSEEFVKLGEKTTVGRFTLRNGFEIITSSSCVYPKNFDMELGKKYCREQVERKVWELEGYLLQQRKWENDNEN